MRNSVSCLASLRCTPTPAGSVVMTPRLRAALLLRLTKCVRVFDFAQELRSSALTTLFFTRKLFTRRQFNLFLFVCFAFFSVHVVACSLYINGWYSSPAQSWFSQAEVDRKNIQERYLHCFYLGVVALTTTGMGHIFFTENFSILASGLILAGNICFGLLVSYLDPVMREHNERSTAYQRQMRVWNQYR